MADHGDLADGSRLVTLMERIAPTEVYHLAAQSHVRVSFDEPEFTGDVTGLATTRILEAIRESKVPARFYQASSSEMFGATPPPQDESTPFYPPSWRPYGAAEARRASQLACLSDLGRRRRQRLAHLLGRRGEGGLGRADLLVARAVGHHLHDPAVSLPGCPVGLDLLGRDQAELACREPQAVERGHQADTAGRVLGRLTQGAQVGCDR